MPPTKSTPEITLDPDLHQLEIKGESYPENTAEFYRPIFEWLDRYTERIQGKEVVVSINLGYFNSSTSKVLMDFFDKLDSVTKKNDIVVNWIYNEEDEDSLEYGQDFQEDLSNLKFKFVPTE